MPINSEARRSVESMLKIFPYIKDVNRLKELKIDDESYLYISRRECADRITNIIIDNMNKLDINKDDCVITDATAGVGGNTISFAKNFKLVNAIEIELERFNYLKNNTSLYELNNINYYNNNCMDVLKEIENHDIVFIDPPWGGRSYKDTDNLRLKLNTIGLEDICNDIFSKKMKSIPKMIVLKLPKNFDIIYFSKKVMSKKMFLYDLDKMYIYVVMNPQYYH